MLKRCVFLACVFLMIAAVLPITHAQEATPDPTLTASDYLLRGDQAMERRNYRGAVTEYGFAIQLEPDNVEAYLKRAQAYIAQNQPDLALADYQQATEIAPESAEAFLALGQLQEQLGDMDAAMVAYNQAIAADAAFIEAYIAKADLLLAQENYATALETVDAGLENGENAILLRQRGWAQLGLESYVAAGQSFDRAIELATEESQDSLAYAGRAIAHANRSERFLEQALTDAEQAITLDRQNAWSYYSRGYVYAVQEEYQRAVNDFGTALRYNPDLEEAYIQRGLAYHALENDRQAVRDFEKVLEYQEEAADYYHLARSHNYIDGNQWRAIEAAQRALTLEPDPSLVPKIILEIGYGYFFLEGDRNAIEYFTLVIENPETSIEDKELAYTYRGISHHALEEYDAAIADFEATLELDPTLAYPHRHLGNLYYDLRSYDLAYYHYQRYSVLSEERGSDPLPIVTQRIRELEQLGVGTYMEVDGQ